MNFKLYKCDNNLHALLQCVQQYLTVMITEGNVTEITCPDGQCRKQGRVDSPEVSFLLSSFLLVFFCLVGWVFFNCMFVCLFQEGKGWRHLFVCFCVLFFTKNKWDCPRLDLVEVSVYLTPFFFFFKTKSRRDCPIAEKLHYSGLHYNGCCTLHTGFFWECISCLTLSFVVEWTITVVEWTNTMSGTQVSVIRQPHFTWIGIDGD
jgi:hypothetical protein